MDVKFNPIDLQTWPRGQMFYYFSKMAPTGYSLTVDLDVTVMKAALKNRKIKFFPAYLWLTTKMLNRQVEFKVAMVDSVLGYWDVLTPLYATFHNEKIMMPFSITVHHATTDGWHIKTFLADLQHDMNHPEIWIDESATI